MVGLFERFVFVKVGGASLLGTNHVPHLHIVPHEPWKYTDRRGLIPILLGKSRVARFQSTAPGIQAQGRTINLGDELNHAGFFYFSCPCLPRLKLSFPLCLAGPWGFLTLNSKFLQPGSILTAGGNGPCVYLLALVSHAAFPAGKLISGPYPNH